MLCVAGKSCRCSGKSDGLIMLCLHHLSPRQFGPPPAQIERLRKSRPFFPAREISPTDHPILSLPPPPSNTSLPCKCRPPNARMPAVSQVAERSAEGFCC